MKVVIQHGNTGDFLLAPIHVITDEVQVQVITEDLMLCKMQFHKMSQITTRSSTCEEISQLRCHIKSKFLHNET